MAEEVLWDNKECQDQCLQLTKMANQATIQLECPMVCSVMVECQHKPWANMVESTVSED